MRGIVFSARSKDEDESAAGCAVLQEWCMFIESKKTDVDTIYRRTVQVGEDTNGREKTGLYFMG